MPPAAVHVAKDRRTTNKQTNKQKNKQKDFVLA